jgi:hypothetical protein
MDGATLAAYKESLRVISFAFDNQIFCLNMETKKGKENWNRLDYSDSISSGDSENLINTTWFIIYLLRTTICWRSNFQEGVTSSSIEAEYVAMFEAVKELRFV